MSKKEIRRAARDAFPKAKGAQAKRGTGGAYSKRKRTVSTGPAARSNAPKPPSIVRSLIFGVIAAVFYFVLIQWIMRLNDTSVYTNLLISVIGLVLFAGINYLTESFRYRRYLKKKGSDQ